MFDARGTGESAAGIACEVNRNIFAVRMMCGKWFAGGEVRGRRRCYDKFELKYCDLLDLEIQLG